MGRTRGFTFVEMLVVLAIIGILITGVLYVGARLRHHRAAAGVALPVQAAAIRPITGPAPRASHEELRPPVAIT